MIATENQFSIETIRKLIKLGCDVNAQNNDGMTCLHISLWNENTHLFKEFIQQGANPKLEDKEGDSVESECESRPQFLQLLNEKHIATSLSETQY